MTVASLENCKKLYELSGNTWWEDIEKYWLVTKNETSLVGVRVAEEFSDGIPAYDLGYLLRKLPRYIESLVGYIQLGHNSKEWFCKYVDWDDKAVLLGNDADTPEDAACLLAIKLFEEGVLRK